MISHPTNNPNVCRSWKTGFWVCCCLLLLPCWICRVSVTLWQRSEVAIFEHQASTNHYECTIYLHGLLCQAAVFTLWLRAVHISPTHHFLRAESQAGGIIMSLHHATSVTPVQAAVTSSVSATLLGGYPPTLFSHIRFIFPRDQGSLGLQGFHQPWFVRSSSWYQVIP